MPFNCFSSNKKKKGYFDLNDSLESFLNQITLNLQNTFSKHFLWGFLYGIHRLLIIICEKKKTKKTKKISEIWHHQNNKNIKNSSENIELYMNYYYWILTSLGIMYLAHKWTKNATNNIIILSTQYSAPGWNLFLFHLVLVPLKLNVALISQYDDRSDLCERCHK